MCSCVLVASDDVAAVYTTADESGATAGSESYGYAVSTILPASADSSTGATHPWLSATARLCAVIAMYCWSAPTEMSSEYISHDWATAAAAPAGFNDLAYAPSVPQRLVYNSSRDDVGTATPGSDIGP